MQRVKGESMRDVIIQLLALQELDEEIVKREERCTAIPREIESIKEMLETETIREKEAHEQLKATKVKRKEAEGKIDLLETKLRKYLDQTHGVKTNEDRSGSQADRTRS
jgi:predicted  nucleic acid-binding Zn-ribbon protein